MSVALHIFKDISFFEDFHQSELESLASNAIVKIYKKNRVVLCEGEEADCVYFILEGKVRVYLENLDGKEVTINTIGSGESFGELSLFCEADRTANVETINESKLLKIKKDDFEKFCFSNLKAARKIITLFASTVKKLTTDFENLALNDVTKRIALTLLEHAQSTDAGNVVQGLTHNEIAHLVASSRETVSRIISSMKKEGLLETSDGKIYLTQQLYKNFY
ncbi:MAG: cyclic nucleotide-binding domain-containing protein [Gammaproteobacteria bacterium]|nr:MAG: cyclic nucleotide-binding domain-containing protein [Gammaproteobacteria bacterium]